MTVDGLCKELVKGSCMHHLVTEDDYVFKMCSESYFFPCCMLLSDEGLVC